MGNQVDREYERVMRYVDMYPDDPSAYNAGFDVMYDHVRSGDKEYIGHNKALRAKLISAMQRMPYSDVSALERMNDIYYKSILINARDDFDDFNLYLERKIPANKKIYMPRRKALMPFVTALQEAHEGKLDFISGSVPKRVGKALPVDTLIAVPDGFKAIGDIKIGDKVVAASGKIANVIGVFPQGEKPVYRVVFRETGYCHEETVVECCEDHLWTVQTEEDRADGRERVMSTKDMLNGTLYRGANKHRNYSVQYNSPIRFEGRNELAIKPYLMGALIANGGITWGIRLSTADDDVLARVANELSQNDEIRFVTGVDYQIRSKKRKTDEHGYCVKSDTGAALDRYGLLGKHSYEKFIPKDYLFASIDDRIALLNGLFDGDGSITNNCCEYSTTSPQLAEDVAFLVRSLGGRCRVVKRMGRYTQKWTKKETRLNYRLFCKFTPEIKPFALKRKLDKYAPKMQVLRHFIEDIVPTNDRKEMVCIAIDDDSHQYLVGPSLIPTHNTTIGTRFVLFREGNSPMSSSLCCGAGDRLVKSFYNGMLEVLTDNEKYSYFEIFPEAQLVATNADDKTIDLQKRTRFASITCRSIDGSLIGNTEANAGGVLYGDDFISGDEQVWNRDRLDVLYNKIVGDLLGRWLGGPIVFFGTRYSLYDPIGRFQDYARDREWRVRIIEIPALDPVTDESNFEMVVDGNVLFTTKYFRDMRAALDPFQWESQYQQQPFEAKGRLFPEDELNRYFELPVDRDPDAVIAVCDTAEKGSDSVMLPVAYIYGDDVFIEDCVFSNATPEHTKPECANMLMKHKVSQCTFESNNAGEYFARDVEQLIKQAGGRVGIRTKRTISNKTTRIENASANILAHFYFKDRSLYEANSEYGQMIKELVTYTRNGKVKHDDSPDGLSLLENMIRNMGAGKVEVIPRIW